MNKPYVTINQQHFTLYSVTLTVDELINNTYVDYYNSETGDGYQRPLVSLHYKKIAKYLQKNPDPILPTAILTAIAPENIDAGGGLIIKDNLRVVDGQHRIEGIRYLKKIDEAAFEKISKFNFPVLIMVIEESQRIHEINAFININKTGKPVSTDLAIELRKKIRGTDLQAILDNFKESISTDISHQLNKTKNNIWYQTIKVGDEKNQGKIISINAFHQSLFPIIENYLEHEEISIDAIKEFEDLVSKLSLFIIESWKIIEERWDECFTSIEDRKIYNIQKGIGVFSLHIVLAEIIDSANGDLEESLINFKQLLKASKVKSTDWLVGGRLSSYNSKSGFQKISNFIKNTDEIPD